MYILNVCIYSVFGGRKRYACASFAVVVVVFFFVSFFFCSVCLCLSHARVKKIQVQKLAVAYKTIIIDMLDFTINSIQTLAHIFPLSLCVRLNF